MPPSDDITRSMLIAHVVGDLPNDAISRRVEAHLASSPEDAAYAGRLRLMIEALAVDLDAEAPSEDVLRRIVGAFRPSGPAAAVKAVSDGLLSLRRVVMDLVFDSRAQPAIAGFRGDTETRQMAWEAPWGRVDLEVATPTGGIRRVRGQVSIDDSERSASGIALCEADAGSTPVATAEPDARGRFAVETAAGVFDLLIAVDAEVLVAPGIDLS